MTYAMKIRHSARSEIRPARKDDAAAIARLFLVSSDGLAAYIWSRLAAPGEAFEAVGTRRYARTGTAFSFENCLLATVDDEIAGMVHAFTMPERGPDETEDDPVLAPYAELEDPGSLYIAGLAVFDAFRRQGIGRALMACAERLAAETGHACVSLICFEGNRAAMRLYARLGYREVARRPIVPHPSLHYGRGDAVLLVRDLGKRERKGAPR